MLHCSWKFFGNKPPFDTKCPLSITGECLKPSIVHTRPLVSAIDDSEDTEESVIKFINFTLNIGAVFTLFPPFSEPSYDGYTFVRA